DYTNQYGVRPFWPFWERWYSWDIVSIIEPALYLCLIPALVLPKLFSAGKPLPHGRAAAILSLGAIVSLYTVRDYEHRRAVRALENMHFNLATPDRASVFPYFWSVFQWYAVVETTDSFATSNIDSATGKLDLKELRFFHKEPETPATLAAKRSYAGRAYLDWAQYPWITQKKEGEKTIVRFKDLRFDFPQMRGSSTLSCTVELDKDLRVVGEVFGSRRQSPPID